jgi:hypothetical protein
VAGADKAGEPVGGVFECTRTSLGSHKRMRCCTSGCAMIFTISLLSLLRIAGGVAFGAMMLVHVLRS